MATFGDKQTAVVRVGEELRRRGFTLFGYSEDRSDSSTDYYAPARWKGVAVHPGHSGLVVCADVSSYDVSSHSGKPQMEQVSVRDHDCEQCGGSGVLEGAATLAEARADYSKYHIAIEAAARGSRMMSGIVSPVHYHEDGRPKCRSCHGLGYHNKLETRKVCDWPTFQATPKGKMWHVEQGGRIIASGTGFDRCSGWGDTWRGAVCAICDEIEQIVTRRSAPTTPGASANNGVVPASESATAGGFTVMTSYSGSEKQAGSVWTWITITPRCDHMKYKEFERRFSLDYHRLRRKVYGRRYIPARDLAAFFGMVEGEAPAPAAPTVEEQAPSVADLAPPEVLHLLVDATGDLGYDACRTLLVGNGYGIIATPDEQDADLIRAGLIRRYVWCGPERLTHEQALAVAAELPRRDGKREPFNVAEGEAPAFIEAYVGPYGKVRRDLRHAQTYTFTGWVVLTEDHPDEERYVLKAFQHGQGADTPVVARTIFPEATTVDEAVVDLFEEGYDDALWGEGHALPMALKRAERLRERGWEVVVEPGENPGQYSLYAANLAYPNSDRVIARRVQPGIFREEVAAPRPAEALPESAPEAVVVAVKVPNDMSAVPTLAGPMWFVEHFHNKVWGDWRKAKKAAQERQGELEQLGWRIRSEQSQGRGYSLYATNPDDPNPSELFSYDHEFRDDNGFIVVYWPKPDGSGHYDAPRVGTAAAAQAAPQSAESAPEAISAPEPAPEALEAAPAVAMTLEATRLHPDAPGNGRGGIFYEEFYDSDWGSTPKARKAAEQRAQELRLLGWRVKSPDRDKDSCYGAHYSVCATDPNGSGIISISITVLGSRDEATNSDGKKLFYRVTPKNRAAAAAASTAAEPATEAAEAAPAVAMTPEATPAPTPAPEPAIAPVAPTIVAPVPVTPAAESPAIPRPAAFHEHFSHTTWGGRPNSQRAAQQRQQELLGMGWYATIAFVPRGGYSVTAEDPSRPIGERKLPDGYNSHDQHGNQVRFHPHPGGTSRGPGDYFPAWRIAGDPAKVASEVSGIADRIEELRREALLPANAGTIQQGAIYALDAAIKHLTNLTLNNPALPAVWEACRRVNVWQRVAKDIPEVSGVQPGCPESFAQSFTEVYAGPHARIRRQLRVDTIDRSEWEIVTGNNTENFWFTASRPGYVGAPSVIATITPEATVVNEAAAPAFIEVYRDDYWHGATGRVARDERADVLRAAGWTVTLRTTGEGFELEARHPADTFGAACERTAVYPGTVPPTASAPTAFVPPPVEPTPITTFEVAPEELPRPIVVAPEAPEAPAPAPAAKGRKGKKHNPNQLALPIF